MQRHRHSKPHVLRAFDDHPVRFHEVGPLQRLVTKVVHRIISIEPKNVLKLRGVVSNRRDVVCVELSNQQFRNGRETIARALVVVRHDDAAGQHAEVGVVQHLRRAFLRRKLVNLLRFNVVVQLVNDVNDELREVQRQRRFDASPQGFYPAQDFVELNDFYRTVAFRHVHFFHGCGHILFYKGGVHFI